MKDGREPQHLVEATSVQVPDSLYPTRPTVTPKNRISSKIHSDDPATRAANELAPESSIASFRELVRESRSCTVRPPDRTSHDSTPTLRHVERDGYADNRVVPGCRSSPDLPRRAELTLDDGAQLKRAALLVLCESSNRTLE